MPILSEANHQSMRQRLKRKLEVFIQSFVLFRNHDCIITLLINGRSNFQVTDGYVLYVYQELWRAGKSSSVDNNHADLAISTFGCTCSSVVLHLLWDRIYSFHFLRQP